jgi:4-amino-4-deoxy-L-arabinose transferase-like glycosyltransferase
MIEVENSRTTPAKKIFNWPLPLILLVALILRLLFLEWAQANAYGGQEDGIEAYEVAAHFEAGDERAQYIGQPNCNYHSKLPGPLWTIFCVAGLKIFGSINGIVLLSIFGNLLAIALTWQLARDLAGERAAHLVALLMAVSPWAVHYSSIVWNPTLMPLLGVIVVLIFLRCRETKNSRSIFLIPLLLLAAAQFHMSTLSLILPLAVTGWLAQLKINWRWLVAGIFVGVASYTPYLLGDARHGWANTHGMLFGGNGGFSFDALKIFSSPFTFLINRWDPGWTYTAADRIELARATFGGNAGLLAANLISVICAVFLAGALGTSAWQAMKKIRSERRGFFVGASNLVLAGTIFVTYLFFNLVAGKPFHSRYCLLVLPLLFIFAGIAAEKCLTFHKTKKIFLSVLVISVAANLWFMPRLCWFEKQRLANSPVFVPGWTKMENIYRRLRQNFSGRLVVLDKNYLATTPRGEAGNIYRHAQILPRYIACRELEAQLAGANFTSTNYFELRASTEVATNHASVAFAGNGIALVAVPENSQR